MIGKYVRRTHSVVPVVPAPTVLQSEYIHSLSAKCDTRPRRCNALSAIPINSSPKINRFLGDSLFHSGERPELNLENDYSNKTGRNLKTNGSISIL